MVVDIHTRPCSTYKCHRKDYSPELVMPVSVNPKRQVLDFI
jgi:hypothetical protein